MDQVARPGSRAVTSLAVLGLVAALVAGCASGGAASNAVPTAAPLMWTALLMLPPQMVVTVGASKHPGTTSKSPQARLSPPRLHKVNQVHG